MYNILILLTTIIAFFRFYYCLNGKKENNPISACSANPHWITYGYKLSGIIYLNIIIIILLFKVS